MKNEDIDSLNILVVDDEAPIALLERKAIEGAGHTVILEQNGSIALERIEQGGIDLVLLDHKMPGLSGEEVLAEISENHPEIPVIIVTGRGDQRLAADVIKFGAADYLVKDAELTFLQTIPKLIRQVYKQRRLLVETVLLQEKLTQSEKRFRSAFEYAAIGKNIGGLDGKFMDVNQAFCEMIGYSKEELLARSIKDVTFPDDFHKDDERLSILMKGDIYHFEVEKRYMHKNGRIVWIQLTVSLVRDTNGEPLYFINQIQDITKRREAEDGLRRAKDIAEKATRLKDEFISLVVHDLKAPFSSIILSLRTLQGELGDTLSEQHKDVMSNAVISGERLVDTIDDLLNISRLHTGDIVPKFSFLNRYGLVVAALSGLMSIADEKGVIIENKVEPNSRTYADRGLYIEALQNLILNAIKFSHRGGVITIFSPNKDNASLSVKDEGVGVKSSLLPDIFKSEVKTGSLGTDGEKGTGFGLPLSLDLMKAMGGGIAVETKEGKGSVFTLELSHVKPVIILVEDDLAFLKAMDIFLNDLDVEIVHAINGEHALTLIQDQPPHLIICDLNMPGMDGYDLLRNLKKDRDLAEIPVIVLTVENDLESREKVFRLGADDYISKPIAPADLIPRVRKFIA